MKYWLVTETFHSAGEKQEGCYAAKAENKKKVTELWQDEYSINKGNSYDTPAGNAFEINYIKEIPEEDYVVLRKYFPTLE